MASIRRTQSPSYRSWSPPPPQQQQLNKDPSRLSSSSSSFVMLLRRLVFGAIFPHRTPLSRRPSISATWKRSLFSFLLFFVLGFFLGFSPFVDLHHDSITPRDSSFEIRSQEVVASMKQEESRDRVVVKQGSRVIGYVGSRDVFKIKPVELEIKKDGVGHEEAKLLIVVTPTYNRAMQGYYLTRLGQTLRLAKPPLLWIVVEMGTASMETADVLRRTGVMYRHLVCQKNSTNVKDRGVHQRNAALEHIERHRMDGIAYFADDDNIYSLELFENMRHIRRFGTLPVSMLAKAKSKAILEGPVCTGSQVIGWHTNEKSKSLRRFHVDMSGFAFNSTILWDPKRWQRPNLDAIRQLDTVNEGFQETTFIEQLVEDESQMEAMPPGCSRIMTWHLHLDAGRFVYYPRGWRLSRNLETVIPLK